MGVMQDSLRDGGRVVIEMPLAALLPRPPPATTPPTTRTQLSPPAEMKSPRGCPGPCRTSHSLLGCRTRPDSASRALRFSLGSRVAPHEDLPGKEKRENVLRSQSTTDSPCRMSQPKTWLCKVTATPTDTQVVIINS